MKGEALEQQTVDPEAFAAFQHLLLPYLEQMGALATAVNRVAEALDRERISSPWIDADEAALLLGIKINVNGYHSRILSRYIDKGLIAKFKEGKPRMYWRVEIQALAIKIAEGKVQYL